MTKKRFNILALIFVTVVINYMDRSNISVAAAAIGEDLSLTKVQLGLIFSAFGLTYSLLQIPGGILVDYVKPRILYPIILVMWSLATLFQGLVSSLGALIGLRASIGVFEAPSYPTNNKIVTSWFPEEERASAIAMYTSGQFIGLAFLTPALVAIQAYYGWRGLFVISGLMGIAWAGIWYAFYRDPQDHETVSEQELALIKAGGGIISDEQNAEGHVNFKLSDLAEAFRHPKLWGIYLGQFCMGSLFIFFLTWFPTYLVEYRGLDFIKSGFLASIPFLAAFFGVLLAGFSSDFLVRRGISKEASRKGPILVGMLLSISIIGANYTDNTALIIFFLALAFFGNGLASITWVFVSLLAPTRLIGLVGGVFNFIGGLAGVVTPTVIGYLVQDGDFSPALFFIGGMAFLGFCSYLFLVGTIERVDVVGERGDDIKERGVDEHFLD
ncbi:MFS transporter [Neolewinella persica]|uniref:MFS transporter n=1 Tax=Neolewinella persica TaxID=70998 RepID=UPI00035D9E05|nr:MFS transporter [Neolewinella persica]